MEPRSLNASQLKLLLSGLYESKSVRASSQTFLHSSGAKLVCRTPVSVDIGLRALASVPMRHANEWFCSKHSCLQPSHSSKLISCCRPERLQPPWCLRFSTFQANGYPVYLKTGRPSPQPWYTLSQGGLCVETAISSATRAAAISKALKNISEITWHLKNRKNWQSDS